MQSCTEPSTFHPHLQPPVILYCGCWYEGYSVGVAIEEQNTVLEAE